MTKPTAFDAPVFDVSEALIQELERSDVVFVCTPMHNLTVPASLKLWIDYVLRIHRTFSSGPDGKTGLLASRPVTCWWVRVAFIKGRGPNSVIL